MAVTKQQLAQWSREFDAKNPDRASGTGSTAQSTTTKKSSVPKEQLSQWSREFDKKEAQRQAEQESMQRAEATAAKSENPAVRQFAEVAASDNLTGKTIGLFTPNAENQENRAAFEQAYGVTLPDTAGATRRMLREIAAQQNVKSEAAPAAQSAELPSEAASVPQTVQDTPAETADAMPETAAPDNVREAAAAAAETDSYENAPLRETLGLRPEAPKTQREAEVQRALEGWRVTDKAAETISKNMPDRVDADRYAAAASPLYRLGRSGADTFAQALELAGSMSGTAADINYILSTDAGRTALEIAYTQGKGERMLYAEKMTELGGALGSESTSGRGEVYAKGTMRQESDVASQIISLNAAATGTDIKVFLCTWTGIIGGVIASLFGGWDTALQTLVIFMAIDYITGLVVAGVFHASPKTKTGALESKAGWKGLIRKGETLLIVLVACQLDAVIGGSFVRDAAIIGFSANEAISIVENAGLMGLPIPAAITKAIDILKQRAETPEKGKD